MKILTSTYRIISIEGEELEGIYFPKYEVFKEISVFGFSLHGKIINNEAFSSIEDAEDFLKLIDNGRE